MIFQFSDGEFSDPIAISLKMWKKINSFIIIIAFSITLEKLNRNPQACPPPQKKNFLHTFFFSPPLKNLLHGPCSHDCVINLKTYFIFL